MPCGSGGRVQVGGGHALQQKLGIKDTADKIFEDWVRYDHDESRFSDRDLIRVFADENVATYDFLIENGVEAARMTAHGYAWDQPVASNKTLSGRAQNRRVELRRTD